MPGGSCDHIIPRRPACCVLGRVVLGRVVYCRLPYLSSHLCWTAACDDLCLYAQIRPRRIFPPLLPSFSLLAIDASIASLVSLTQVDWSVLYRSLVVVCRMGGLMVVVRCTCMWCVKNETILFFTVWSGIWIKKVEGFGDFVNWNTYVVKHVDFIQICDQHQHLNRCGVSMQPV